MTSKEIQVEFIKTYLKPTLKTHGYNTSSLTWWKKMGDFFIVINLQNSQYNSKEELSFCLNIGVALTAKLADKAQKKATYYDLAAHDRQYAYMTEDRKTHNGIKGGWLGYLITDRTNVTEFIMDFKVDLEDNILKTLEDLKTLQDCLSFYKPSGLCYNNLKRQIEECGIQVE